MLSNMNFRRLFQDFNPSKFLLFFMLFVFTILLALRLDGAIEWSYWAVFTPVWIWKLFVFCGAFTGIYLWIKRPEYRGEGESYIEFKAMMICLFLHMLLFIFEILVCINLDKKLYAWRIMFMPLYVLSSVSIIACVWGFRHDRSVELETVFSVNILQFIFLALKLDNVIRWQWVVVFVPMWIVLSLLCLLVLYYIIWSIIFVRTAEVLPAQRHGHVMVAVASVLLVIPLLVFQIILSNWLDSENKDMFVGVVAPLQISLLSLLTTSFYHKGGNHWWFGMRKDFCEFLLGICPCLQEYGNVSYKFPGSIFIQERDHQESSLEDMHRKPVVSDYQSKPVVPIVSIEMPD
ncbi:transmembrane protein 185B [Exaiptasia diaphana]|uniref:Transmembrane protein 185B n=1 Tax=Exaiptasia diaphana TaxID=2652724 RepID=A0A913XIA1_EXADI|nr:transmembrane protein 185B [Exaiptasia diaphana]KXJ25882.1 Transmembrane protein 185B [Exaiptasia diaphana]